MTMYDLILRLRVEKVHRKGDKNDKLMMEAKAYNMIEGKSTKPKFQKNKGIKKGCLSSYT